MAPEGLRLILSSDVICVFLIYFHVLFYKETSSWLESGVQGLQSVVLYSLPELDGAIETIVLGMA